MKANAADIIQAIASIDLIPSRAGISSSEFIRIQASKDKIKFSLAAEIYGTTYAAALEGKETWEFFVDRASFVPFVLAAKELGQTVPFEFRYSAKDSTLTVRCGKRKASYQTVTEISGYADKADFKGAALVLTKEQKTMLRLAVKYATSDPTVAHLNCIYLSKGKAILASNQLAAFYLEDKVVPLSVPLPLLLLSILDSDLVEGITVSKEFARVDLACGFLCQLTNQKAAESFPHATLVSNVEAGAKFKKRFSVKGSSMVAVLKRLEAYIASVVKRDMVVSVAGTKGDTKLRITATIPQGSFEESLTVKEPLVRDVECEWLLSLLLPLADIATSLGTVTVRYDDMSPFYFSSNGVRLLAARKS